VTLLAAGVTLSTPGMMVFVAGVTLFACRRDTYRFHVTLIALRVMLSTPA
jgi:multisubunit Na+/H+ antiporter MnhG subunit